jgi:CheY-like chemotaxis protein
MHILLADDDKEDFMIFQEAANMTNHEFILTYAANWMDLWRILLKTLPDVLFLDLNMPVKDGFECLLSVREDSRFNAMPIVIYSTSVNKNDIDKAYEYGANYFIVKPNSTEGLTTLLDLLVEMKNSVLGKKPERDSFVIL